MIMYLCDTVWKRFTNRQADGKDLIILQNQVEGLFLNCAMNSRGIQLSGGIGNEMAQLLGEQIRKDIQCTKIQQKKQLSNEIGTLHDICSKWHNWFEHGWI